MLWYSLHAVSALHGVQVGGWEELSIHKVEPGALCPLPWRARYGPGKVGNRVAILFDHIAVLIGLRCVALIRRRCRRLLLVLGGRLGWWNLNDIGRCRIGERVVWIVVGWRHRDIVVGPPEGAIETSDNYPTEKEPECCTIRSPSSVVVPGIPSVVASRVVAPAVVVSSNVSPAIAPAMVSSPMAASVSAVAPRAAVATSVAPSARAPGTAERRTLTKTSPAQSPAA